MKTKIAVLALIAVTAGVFTYSRTQRALPSDLRDAVGEEIKNNSGVPFAEMKIAKKAAEPVKLSGDFKSAPKAKTTEAKKRDAVDSKVPALAVEKKEEVKKEKKELISDEAGYMMQGAMYGAGAGAAVGTIVGAMAVAGGLVVSAVPIIVGAVGVGAGIGI